MDCFGKGDELLEIRAGSFKFTIAPNEPLVLPSYKGATLRGGFGHAFKRVVCALRRDSCAECLLEERCIYSYIFETPPPPDTKIMRKYKTAPHPFIIEPPSGMQKIYKPGDEIVFGLILVGRAIDYMPYFVYTFDELGRIGIGKGRGKFTLKEVRCGGDVIYDSESKTIKPFKTVDLPLFAAAGSPRPGAVTLSFLTPTRITYNGHLTLDLEFHMLIRNLLRRLSMLYYFHCGGDPSSWNFRDIIAGAQGVKVEEHNLRWHDWERYSSRQDTRMKLGGFVGTITFEGDIEPFMPLLAAGELLHVGKGTSFGLGKYEIRRK